MNHEELIARVTELANHADRLKGVDGMPSDASLFDRVKEASTLIGEISNAEERKLVREFRDRLESFTWGGGSHRGQDYAKDSAEALYSKLRALERDLKGPEAPPKEEPVPVGGFTEDDRAVLNAIHVNTDVLVAGVAELLDEDAAPPVPEPDPTPPPDTDPPSGEHDWEEPGLIFTPTKEEQSIFFHAGSQLDRVDAQGFSCRFTVTRGAFNDGQDFDPPSANTNPKHILCNLRAKGERGLGQFYLFIQEKGRNNLTVRHKVGEHEYKATVTYRMPEGVPVTFDYSYRAGHPPTLVVFEDGDAIESLAFQPDEVAAPLTLGPGTNIRFGQQIDDFQPEGHNEASPLGWSFADFSLDVIR